MLGSEFVWDFFSIRSYFSPGSALNLDRKCNLIPSLPFACFCGKPSTTKPRFVIFHPQQFGSDSTQREAGNSSRPTACRVRSSPHVAFQSWGERSKCMCFLAFTALCFTPPSGVAVVRRGPTFLCPRRWGCCQAQ